MMNNEIQKRLKDNLWNLLVTIFMIGVTYGLLRGQVNAMQIKLDTYPSEEYFNLRFETLERDVRSFSGKLDRYMEK